jgi:catechol 2,3-dioxygenase-like lactoylglutathione lyase family enzyme
MQPHWQREDIMIQVRRIGHATLETPDIDRQIEYFTGVTGLVLAEREPNRAFLASKLGPLTIQLERADAPRCARLAFEVAPDTDFAAAERFLTAEGIRSERRSDANPGVRTMLTFTDPNGVAIDLFPEWKPLALGKESRGIGVLKLGHLAHIVDDPKKVAEFYCRILGFRVSDWIEDWFVFLRCGADHHTVNFVTGKQVKMHHMAFELKDWAHMQTACELFGQRRIPIIWGPGRHTAGHNLFTYHRNPDDQIVELFAELDLMKDESLGYFEPRPWHRDHPQRPKTWQGKEGGVIWGPPPTPDYIRQRGEDTRFPKPAN